MAYRDKIDIISQILEAANGGASKTRIMYKAALNYNQMKQYVKLLTEKGLLGYDQQEVQTFRTTEKGLQFLDIYNRTSDMIKEEQQPQQQMWIHREEEA
ncbi:MAG: winged helix-turn-helix domain-containing protein [Thermoproteota archaeon]|nr:winged helix-turn-helix domain-containing protein [Thermoproteota archaeon]